VAGVSNSRANSLALFCEPMPWTRYQCDPQSLAKKWFRIQPRVKEGNDFALLLEPTWRSRKMRDPRPLTKKRLRRHCRINEAY